MWKYWNQGGQLPSLELRTLWYGEASSLLNYPFWMPKKQLKCWIIIFIYTYLIWTSKDIRKTHQDELSIQVWSLLVMWQTNLEVKFHVKQVSFPRKQNKTERNLQGMLSQRYRCWSGRSRRTRSWTTGCASTGKTRWWWACSWCALKRSSGGHALNGWNCLEGLNESDKHQMLWFNLQLVHLPWLNVIKKIFHPLDMFVCCSNKISPVKKTSAAPKVLVVELLVLVLVLLVDVVEVLVTPWQETRETMRYTPWKFTWNKIMEFWFRSCSFLNGGFLGSSR